MLRHLAHGHRFGAGRARRQQLLVADDLGGKMAGPTGKIPATEFAGDFTIVEDHGATVVEHQLLDLLDFFVYRRIEIDQHHGRARLIERGLIEARCRRLVDDPRAKFIQCSAQVLMQRLRLIDEGNRDVRLVSELHDSTSEFPRRSATNPPLGRACRDNDQHRFQMRADDVFRRYAR